MSRLNNLYILHIKQPFPIYWQNTPISMLLKSWTPYLFFFFQNLFPGVSYSLCHLRPDICLAGLVLSYHIPAEARTILHFAFHLSCLCPSPRLYPDLPLPTPPLLSPSHRLHILPGVRAEHATSDCCDSLLGGCWHSWLPLLWCFFFVPSPLEHGLLNGSGRTKFPFFLLF